MMCSIQVCCSVCVCVCERQGEKETMYFFFFNREVYSLVIVSESGGEPKRAFILWPDA